MSQNVNEKIAQRAYELYMSRGGEHGSDMDDWLRAEREVGSREKSVNKTTVPPKIPSAQRSDRRR